MGLWPAGVAGRLPGPVATRGSRAHALNRSAIAAASLDASAIRRRCSHVAAIGGTTSASTTIAARAGTSAFKDMVIFP
jgi:hypothetical protein